MSHEYMDVMEEALAVIGSAGSISSLVSVAIYVFSALAIYTIAQRRGIRHPWMAWVPVLNVWILGSISDQYRYVVKGQVKSKRKTMLILSAIQAVLGITVVVLLVVLICMAMFGGLSSLNPMDMFAGIGAMAIGTLVAAVLLVVVAMANSVVYFMALYDLYSSCEPDNNVLYLVLSIIPGISRVTKPLFLFLCRNEDAGMPPRKETV